MAPALPSRGGGEDGGIIKTLIIIVGIFFILGYFGISIRKVANSETSQDNVKFVTEAGKKVWYGYLAAPFDYLWNDVFVDILWAGFIDNMKRLRDDEPTVLDQAGSNLVDFGEREPSRMVSEPQGSGTTR